MIEKKNEMFFLFYLSLIIKNNNNLVNFSFSIGFINKIHSINNNDESNIYKNILISKIILELIDYYKSNQIFAEKNNIKEKNTLNKIEKDNNKIIDNYIKHFEIIGLKITQKDLKLKKIDLIYSEIINILLKIKDYDSSYKIIEQLDLENIKITETIFNEISKNLSPNGSYINDYKLNTFDDLFDSKKIDFYHILFKFILKNSIYIYYIDFLNETRKTIIKIIHSKQNQLKDYNFKDKVIDIIKFFTNSDDDMKYININDSNLNSNLIINNEKKQIDYEPLENSSYIEKKQNSQRGGSSLGLNVETSQSTDERIEENQSNQSSNQNNINNEEIINPLEGESFKNRENENSLDSNQIEGNIMPNIEGTEKYSHRDIIDIIENILRNSSITLSINNVIENKIEYGKMEYPEGIGIIYEKFKNLLSDEQTQKWIKDNFNNLFENFQKLICYLENIKEIANTSLSKININLIIIIKFKELNEEDSNNNNQIKNLISEYNIKNSPLRGKTYQDINILLNNNYEGFKSFLREIENNPLQISSILQIENSISNSNGTLWAILEQINKHFFISLRFIKVIGKHEKIAEKIRELDNGNFISDGYNEIFKYNMNLNTIEKYNFNDYYSFFIDKNKVIISQENKLKFLDYYSRIITTNYSCRNLFNFKNSKYIYF